MVAGRVVRVPHFTVWSRGTKQNSIGTRHDGYKFQNQKAVPTALLCAVARDDIRSTQSAQKVSLLHTHRFQGSRAHYQQLTLSQYHLATMISQRVIVLSALVALFALLSTADAQQQLRANNKRVLLEQEVSRVDIEPTCPFVWGGSCAGSTSACLPSM